ncbi:MAG: chorismate mutase [Lawsonella sp.]
MADLKSNSDDSTSSAAPQDGDPTGTDDALSAAQINELRLEIDRLDKEILEAIQRRTEISQLIGKTRKKSGGPRLVHNRELKVIERFNPLGKEGHQLALLLLRLGRGPLG